MQENDIVYFKNGSREGEFGEIIGIYSEEAEIGLFDDSVIRVKFDDFESASLEDSNKYLKLLLKNLREALSESYAAYDTLNFDFKRIIKMTGASNEEGVKRILQNYTDYYTDFLTESPPIPKQQTNSSK